MTEKLAWGIVATGSIARTFARGLKESKTGTLLAVASRTQEAAEHFGDEWDVPRRYGSYEALLADKDVQAVYIATPHPQHAEWVIKAAEAGKHILCEKPIGINRMEAMAMIEAAIRNDVFLMEAYMYRCHPQTAKLIELVQSGVIGTVQVIQATFSFQTSFRTDGRLLSKELGGGGILDVGGYTTSMVRLIAGVAMGKPFAEPIEVKGVGHLGETGVDEYAIASLKFPGGIVAQLFTGVRANGENTLRIIGSQGAIFVPSPWTPGFSGNRLFLDKKGEPREEIVIAQEGNLYAIEADTVAANIEQRQAAWPAMSWDDSLGNMATQDRWRESIKLVYERERSSGPDQHLTMARRTLAVAPGSVMKYGQVRGVEKPVARLVMGVDNQTFWPHAVAMFDDYFERGGNCFDTAYIYRGEEYCEKILGQWVKNRGVREQVVILDKGAHTPDCYPEALTKQLLVSLDRLQMDYVDIYMMHRDNLAIPVGEFITVLNEHKNAGRMRAFGASNWSIERLSEANSWAEAHGMTGFSAISNNFSLARMVDPVWDGCIAASDPESRAWLKQTQMAIMPWSSQARGFFTERAGRDKLGDRELVRCWYSDDNFQRRERVVQMAQERGVLPINIALAYVLCQPFPTFPLIGPRTLSETRTSWPALTIELTPAELRWLNLEV